MCLPAQQHRGGPSRVEGAIVGLPFISMSHGRKSQPKKDKIMLVNGDELMSVLVNGNQTQKSYEEFQI